MRRVAGVVMLLSVLLLAGCQTSPVREATPAGRAAAENNVQLGVQYMRRGRHELALEKLRRALDQDPSYAGAHNAIAVLYEQLGETSLANKHFTRALELSPDDSSGHNNYGRFLCQQGQYAEADRHFMQAVSNPVYRFRAQTFYNAGLCALRQPDVPRGEQYLRRALEVDPLYAPALLRMAGLSLEEEQYLRARAYLSRYQAVARHTAESLWIGVLVERALGDNDAVSSYAMNLKSNFADSEQARLLRESE